MLNVKKSLKKGLLVLSGLAVLVLILILGNNAMDKNTTKENKEMDEGSYIDNNGLVPVDVSGKEVKNHRSLELDNRETACLAYEPTIENYIGEADIIVKGEVVDIEYFDCEDVPWSRLKVMVQDVISGDIENTTEIAVYVMEGFQYNGVDKKSLTEVSGDSLGLHNIGDISVFVLNEEDGSNIFEEGSYRRTFGCYSEYRYMKDKKKYNIYDTRIEENMDEVKLEKKIDSFIISANAK